MRQAMFLRNVLPKQNFPFHLPNFPQYFSLSRPGLTIMWKIILVNELPEVAAMRFLPIFLDTAAGVVIVVGSGEACARQATTAARGGRARRWFSGSADVAEEMLALSAPSPLEISLADPLEAEWSDAVAVVSAAGDPLDGKSPRARRLRIPVNVVDRPELSTFMFPAIVDRGEVVVAIGTGGPCAGAGAAAARAHRGDDSSAHRRPCGVDRPLSSPRRGSDARAFAAAFWQTAVDGPIGARVLAGRTAQAEAALVGQRASAMDTSPTRHCASQALVFLVGAGPGDPDLLTLRALQVLQDADIVFYDELVTEAILDRARRDAELVFVGKRRGEPGIGQDEINRRLVEAARAGLRVVRLKGGDPFVFGRGGEELDHLRAPRFRLSVVPGITAALGCAAEAGLPLTLRNEATRFTFVTAHRADDAAAIDWSGLTDSQTTVVVYMGLASAAAVRDGLVAAGRDPPTPAAVLARGTRPDARAVVGRLDELPRWRPRPAQARRCSSSARWWRAARPGARAELAVAGTRRMTSPLQKKLKVNGSGGGDRQPARRRRRGLPRGRRRLDQIPLDRRGGDDDAGRARLLGGRRPTRARGRRLCRAGRADAGSPRAAGKSARTHPLRRPDHRAAGPAA